MSDCLACAENITIITHFWNLGPSRRCEKCLNPTAVHLGYIEHSSLDPDYAPLSDQFSSFEDMDESFYNYLNRSRSVLADAGFQVTKNTTEMNVFVTTISDTPPTGTQPTGTQPTGPGFQIDTLMVAILIPLSAILIVGVVVLVRRKE